MTISYVTNDDCSSTFTEISIDGTATIYETDSEGNMEIVHAMPTVVAQESSGPCEYSREVT